MDYLKGYNLQLKSMYKLKKGLIYNTEFLHLSTILAVDAQPKGWYYWPKWT